MRISSPTVYSEVVATARRRRLARVCRGPSTVAGIRDSRRPGAVPDVAEAAVEQRVSESPVSVDLAALRPWNHQPGLITVDDELRSLASEQPMAAIGVIRADLRQALRALVPRLLPGRAIPLSLEDALSAIDQSGKLWPEQTTLIRVLLEALDQALLSSEADETDANRLIGLVDTLNLSFPIGYSPNFSPNRHWDEQGLICEYEHCIENMPLPDIPRSERITWKMNIEAAIAAGRYDDDPSRKAMLTRMVAQPIPDDAPEEVDRTGACPVFGHYCPGGEQRVQTCDAATDWTDAIEDLARRDSGSSRQAQARGRPVLMFPTLALARIMHEPV